jgi:hypothetical protein
VRKTITQRSASGALIEILDHFRLVNPFTVETVREGKKQTTAPTKATPKNYNNSSPLQIANKTPGYPT